MTDIDFSTETRELHQLSKEFLALREDLVAFHTQLKYLQNAFELLPLPHNQTTTITTNNTTNPFDVLISQAEICSRWPDVYRERINICIQLVSKSQAKPPHTSHARTARTSDLIIAKST